MTSLDNKGDGMTTIHGSASDVVLHVENIASLPAEIYDALVECTAFVNWRRLDLGQPALLILSFYV